MPPHVTGAVAAPAEEEWQQRATCPPGWGVREQPQREVDGGSGGHSLFAQSLLDVLDRVQAPITAAELSGAVSARFLAMGAGQRIAQRPSYAPIAFAGHEAGDFVLAPRP